MARVTTFGVFAVYKGLDGEITVRPPAAYPTAEKALAAAKTFGLIVGGAVAYSRVIDLDTGVAENGVIIGKFGVMANGQPAKTEAA